MRRATAQTRIQQLRKTTKKKQQGRPCHHTHQRPVILRICWEILDSSEDIHALDYSPKDRVFAVQVGTWSKSNKADQEGWNGTGK